MKAVVLVGGEGTRLRPLTFAIPKQMLPVAGLTMIERVLAALARHGVDEVVLAMGYRPDAFVEAFPDGRVAGVPVTYAVEPEPRDTAGAIRFAADHAGIDETFLVVNGDVLTDLDVAALVAMHRRTGAEATIALTPVEDPSAFGVVPTDDKGRVMGFIEKPPPAEAVTNLINAGTYVMEPSVLGRIAQGRRVSVERETFPALAADGSLFAMASDAYWIDTGTPALYLQANRDAVAGRRGLPPVAGAVERDPGVWVQPGAGALEGRLEGPCLVQDGSVVAQGATVSGSILCPGVVVQAEAVVVGSVLLAGVVIEKGARVEGSVVGGGSVVGAGACVQPLSVIGCQARVPAGELLAGARFPAWD
jgi:mannose-1-phosphate guanylyltransferase